MFEKMDSLDSVPIRHLPPTRRRICARFRCHLATPARLVAPKSGRGEIAWVQNLSRGGAGLLLPHPLDAETHVELELLGAQNQRARVTARVAHATRRSDGNWLVGCEFLAELTEEEMETLL
jgi:hypothetical protein